VKTHRREVIVRASGIENVKEAGVFLRSLNHMFGIGPGNVLALEAVNNTLSGFKAFVYPKILEKHRLDREYVVVELLGGATLESFSGLSKEELIKFGRNLAIIHSRKLDYWGNPSGTFKVSLENANRHIIQSMHTIVKEFYWENHKILNALPRMERALRDIPPPEDTSYVLVDMDPTQFLADRGRITGLCDTEAYVIAPRALDFIALEYVLDRNAAQFVSQGYQTIMELPDLRHVRTVYRYLYRLIEIQGDEDLDEWLWRPELF
jgi:aminoglycoside phosphotransferase (APT) family kinase protein